MSRGCLTPPLAIISAALESFFKFLNYKIKEPMMAKVNTNDEFGVMGSLINENIIVDKGMNDMRFSRYR